MKLPLHQPLGRTHGFTMVELSLCIAIVAIAMVALIGILPTGLTVQQQNREEVVIAKEAQLWFDLIRNGSTYQNSLTNFVDSIRLTRWFQDGAEPVSNSPAFYSGIYDPLFQINGTTPTAATLLDSGLVDASRIVGLVSRPRVETIPDGANRKVRVTNTVQVLMRPASGPVTERAYLGVGQLTVAAGATNAQSFRYLATIEVADIHPAPPKNPTNGVTASDIRITFQWPLIYLPVTANGFPKVRVGPNTHTFRSQVDGRPIRLTGTNVDTYAAFSTNSVNRPTYLYQFLPGTL